MRTMKHANAVIRTFIYNLRCRFNAVSRVWCRIHSASAETVCAEVFEAK